MNKKIIYLIIGIIIIILALFGFNKFLKKEVIEDPLIEEIPVEIPVEVISVDNLVVPDQAPGDEVYVEKVLLRTDGEGGFVTIHKTNEEEEAGNMIGVSAYLETGVTENLLVVLNEGEIIDNPSDLVAVLHADDGDGVWNPETDLPLLDDEGNIVQIVFTMGNVEDVPGFDAKL